VLLVRELYLSVGRLEVGVALLLGLSAAAPRVDLLCFNFWLLRGWPRRIGTKGQKQRKKRPDAKQRKATGTPRATERRGRRCLLQRARQKSATVPAILPACFLCSALSCERERAAAVNANEQQWNSALSKRTTSLVLSLLNPLFLSMYSLSAVRVRGTLSSAAGQQSLP
jgi:hypothetical protein